MSNKFYRILNRIITFFFILFPYFPAISFGIIYKSGGWASIYEGHDPEYFFLPGIHNNSVQLLPIAFILILFLLIILLSRSIPRKRKESGIITLLCSLIIFGIAFSIRLCFISKYKNDIVPFSDFDRVWHLASGDIEGHINYYRIFPAYVNFAVFEKNIITLFGNDYINIIYINCLLSSISAVLIFLITANLVNNSIIGLFSGLLYALMPANILFCAVGAPDFLAVLFNLAGCFCFVKGFSTNNLRKLVLCFIGGILIGIGRAYKEFGIVIIIAFAVVKLMGLWRSGQRTRRLILNLIISLTFVFVSSQFTKELFRMNSEKVFNIDLNYRASTPHFLTVGLNTQGEGQIHVGQLSRAYYLEFMRNGYSFEAAKTYAFDLLKQDWKDNSDKILHNFYLKTIWAWQDDNIPLTYFLRMLPEAKYAKESMFRFFNEDMPGVEQVCYMISMLLACAGTALYVFQNRDENSQCPIYVVILTIFGYFCLMLLSESQSRYKFLIMPFICVMAAIPLNFISLKIKRK